jgi:hypothetical protein
MDKRDTTCNISNNETPVVLATIVTDDSSVMLVRNCRDCNNQFNPIGPNTSTRMSFRCDPCNKKYEKNCLTNTIIGNCCVS